MRALLILLLVGVTLPVRAAADISIQLGIALDQGTFVPQSETTARDYAGQAYDLTVSLEDGDSARTVFGTKVRAHARLMFGLQGEDERFVPGGEVEPGLNARLQLAAGTLWSIFEANGFELLLNSSFEYWVTRPYFNGMAFNFNGGLRGEYRLPLKAMPIRLLAGYDIKPLWFGIDRVEHLFTVRALVGYVGLRATALIGSERVNDVDQTRREVGLSAEVVW